MEAVPRAMGPPGRENPISPKRVAGLASRHGGKKDAAGSPRNDGLPVRVGKGRPVHAQGMRDLVGLSADIRQGHPFDAMRVDFELRLGTARMRVDEGEFSLALRTCYVGLRSANCSARTHSHHRAFPAEGDVKAGSLETSDAT